ncbi:MAG: lysophospholipid acyltransferase family protein [Candidatus Aminicenantes bacterium]|nr:MAG: lysophospholipid acyltransferase family protein [Candidatus Aminicenantes bacterium]
MPNIKERLEFLIFQIVKFFFTHPPRRLCLLAGRVVGLIFYCLDKKHRQIALKNLTLAFGTERTPAELKKIARESFKHFGGFLAEIIKFPRLKEEKKSSLFHVEGEEHLLEALQKQKGAILFSAHYGNWEIAPYILIKKGKMSVVARPLDNRLMEAQLLKLRESLGTKVIYKHRATKQILQSLREKEMIALLIDQNVLRSQAIFVDFFGKKAATTPSVAAFFLRTKSPLLPVFCYPTSSHTYQLKIFSPLKISSEEDHNQEILKITQICTKIIEDQIRKNPSHWLWFHNRWKTRPEGEK